MLLGNFQGLQRIAFWACFCTELICVAEQALSIKWKLSAEWDICHLWFLAAKCLWMRLITFKYDIFDYFKSCHYKYQGKHVSFKYPSHSLTLISDAYYHPWWRRHFYSFLCTCVYVCVHAHMRIYTDAWGAHVYVCEVVFGLSEDM